MPEIFVTGAPGWLGTRFVELVSKGEAPGQKKNYRLRCLVYPGLPEEELKKFGASIVHGGVTQPESLRGAMKGCEAAVHMAGIIHPKNVREFYELNYRGTQNILNEALAAGVRKIIFISSNSPAGFSLPGRPFTEEANTWRKTKFLKPPGKAASRA